jgi:hypothetical protein
MTIDRRTFITQTAGGIAGLGVLNSNVLAAPRAADTVKLRVTVQGLVAVVLVDGDESVSMPASVPRADVVLINNAFTAPHEPRHTPRLFLPLRQVEPSWTRNFQSVTKEMNDRRLQTLGGDVKPAAEPAASVVYLDVRDFEVSFRGEHANGAVQLASGAISECPPVAGTVGAWAPLEWLADIKKLCGKGTVDPSCLSMDPKRSVGARVKFTGGKLACRRPGDANYAGKIWKFDRFEGLPEVTQAVADSVVFEADAPAFTLLLKPFAGVAGTGALMEMAIPAKPGQTINVVINNEPSRIIHDRDKVDHFGLHYDLLPAADRPATPPIPRLFENARCKAREIRAVIGDPNYCPASRFIGKSSSGT